MAKLGVTVVVVLLALMSARPARAQVGDAGRFALTLHGRVSQATARSERAAWLSLSVPFDALARPRVAATQPATEAQPTDPATSPSASSATTAPSPDREPALGFAQLAAFAEFSRQATRAALALAGTGAERRRLDSLAARSRLSAALPDLRLRVQRSTDQALRWAPTNDDPYRITQADGAGTTLEATVTFKLDRLVFSSDELAVERLRQQAGAERLKLEQRVLEGLLGLYRARELSCLEDAKAEARALQRIRTLELLTELEALTGGWFAEKAPALGRAIWGFPEAVLGVCRAPEARTADTNPVASLNESE